MVANHTEILALHIRLVEKSVLDIIFFVATLFYQHNKHTYIYIYINSNVNHFGSILL